MPKLYIGNLAYSTTNEDLEALFSRVGKVESAAVVMDKFSGKSKGFGFVEMADSNDASRWPRRARASSAVPAAQAAAADGPAAAREAAAAIAAGRRLA
jgi:hypothetical protein